MQIRPMALFDGHARRRGDVLNSVHGLAAPHLVTLYGSKHWNRWIEFLISIQLHGVGSVHPSTDRSLPVGLK